MKKIYGKLKINIQTFSSKKKNVNITSLKKMKISIKTQKC